MTKLFIEESSLTDIGDAIREKTGDTDLLSPSGMADAIRGLIVTDTDIPEDAFVIRGDEGQYMFYESAWYWFFDAYKYNITTEKLTDTAYMFSNFSSNRGESFTIPLNFNFQEDVIATDTTDMFAGCVRVTEIGDFYNWIPYRVDGMFSGCMYLRYLPNFINLRTHNKGVVSGVAMFSLCYSLRTIPEDFLKTIYSPYTDGFIIQQAFFCCYSLDEIRGLNPQSSSHGTNKWTKTLVGCNRIKNLIFATQEDGTPYSCDWSNQTIDLREAGFIPPLSAELDGNESDIKSYNTGITADKKVTDAASYAALKDDPDWYTTKAYYCRFNRQSMVNMINTLPDVSQGTGNTIKAYTGQGALTDGGGLGDLAAEEIAVAAAKGWTITLTNHSWFPYEPTTE